MGWTVAHNAEVKQKGPGNFFNPYIEGATCTLAAQLAVIQQTAKNCEVICWRLIICLTLNAFRK